MPAIPPNTYLEGFKKSMCDGIDGAFNKGVKHGRYLALQEHSQLKEEHEALLKRFRHLLESDFIRSFDEYDLKTGTYKRDISEADEDKVVRCKDCICSKPMPEERKIYFADGCMVCVMGRGTPSFDISVVLPDEYCSSGVRAEVQE